MNNAPHTRLRGLLHQSSHSLGVDGSHQGGVPKLSCQIINEADPLRRGGLNPQLRQTADHYVDQTSPLYRQPARVARHHPDRCVLFKEFRYEMAPDKSRGARY
jgi:hypothetical protein